MKNTLQKFSPQWLKTMGIVVMGNLLGLLISRWLIGAHLSLSNYGAFIGLSLFLGLLSGAGALGFSTFFFTYIFFDIAAMAYAYWIIFTRKGSGWEDLTSMAAFLTTLLLGLLIAIALEVYARWRRKKASKTDHNIRK